VTSNPPIEIKDEVVLVMEDHHDSEDPLKVVENARAQDQKTRFDRTRMTL